MTLERADFTAFFQAVHGGNRPFAWQERLLDELLEAGCWPDRIVAPTGAGKTAALDVHVFAVALTARTHQPRLPRRLAMVVGRRVLVDDQYEHAQQVAATLRNPQDDVLTEVAARLRELRRPVDQSPLDGADAEPLIVARLRGGASPSRDWRDEPTACEVICATPDMWGSRLLFRGYGTATRARPREAGLLAVDAAVIVDEAHLSAQLLTTARQVAKLVSVAEQPLPVPGLQVVETTATPAGGTPAGRSVGVEPEDLDHEPLLRDRLTTPKPVSLVPTKDWQVANLVQRSRVAALIADQVTDLLAERVTMADQHRPAHTVGCYVNTVATAVEVARALRNRAAPGGEPVRVVMVCGQTRPADLGRLRREHPGVLDTAGNAEVDVIVTTQSLEVGVDLDLAGVVTELAPGSALVQRAGRVNRRGLLAAGPVSVIVPAGPLTDRARSGPYGPSELREALDWITSRATDPNGLAPWSTRTEPPPPATRRRMLHQRPEVGDVWHWARTGDQLAAEPQLDLWLAESFEEETSVGIVVRDAMPADAADAVSLVSVLQPRDHEVFSVPPATARSILTLATRDSDDPDAPERPQAVRVRGDEISTIGATRPDVRPGDILVIDSRTPAFTPSTASFVTGFSPPTPITPDTDPTGTEPASVASTGTVQATTTRDVLHDVAQPQPGQVALRLEPSTWSEADRVRGLLEDYAQLANDAATPTRLRRHLADSMTELAGAGPTGMAEGAVALLRGPARDSDLIPFFDEQDELVRLIVLDRRRAWADERVRQTWLPRDKPVLLDVHQNAVADRSASIGAHTHLSGPLTEVLRLAGLHHDDGKADPRFQAGLGANGCGVLAKSGGRTAAEFRELAAQAGLPHGWRHEQRSVVTCWEALHAVLPEDHAQLAARLVGTSHGHGRHGFPHTAVELLTGDDTNDHHRLAEQLFDLGDWETLIDATHRRWGTWGCAYLEALLRAADGQVSREGT